MTGEKMMVRVGGGYFKFDDYIPQNQQYYQRTLLMHMLKSKMSLEWVCEAIMNDQKIPQALNSPYAKGQRHSEEITIERRPAEDDELFAKSANTNRAKTAKSRLSLRGVTGASPTRGVNIDSI